MKGKVRWAAFAVLYLAGLCIFAVPDINNLKNHLENQAVYEAFQENQAAASEEGQSAPREGAGETDSADFSLLYEQMREYNEQICAENQKDLCDPWAYEQSSFDLSQYGIEDNVAAVIEIPRMDVELPVYLGATWENMALGAVQLGQTSLPIGGVSTNCVIAAHRGYKGIPMFRDIEELRPGDTVIIRNFWETLTYEVSEIEIIDPSDVSKILIRPGEDMVTLLTCHPYTGNSQRYAVFCTRVSVNTQNAETAEDPESGQLSSETAEQAAAEDGAILEREKNLRTAGYVFLGLVGAAAVGRGVSQAAGRKHRRKRKKKS